MAGYVRLQPMTKVTTSQAQRVEGAVDLGEYGDVTVQVRVAVAGASGSVMYLQHAAELEEQSFTDCASVALDAVGAPVVLLPAPLRYLRWRAALVGGSATFQVDLVGRQRVFARCAGMGPPSYFQLQDLRTIETDHTTGITFSQDLYEAVEVLPYRTLVVQVRRPYLSSTGGTWHHLFVEHAAELAEDAFVPLGSSIDLDLSANQVAVFSRPLRYIRWRVFLSSPPKTLRFQVDVIARET